jgi:DNA-binding SARP family transcriptional activator
VAVTPLDLSLAEGVTVDLRDARALAHRILDRDATSVDNDLSPHSLAALSLDILPDWYEDWVLVEAEEWRQLRLHALEALVDRLIEVERFGEACAAALSAVRTEPLRESARAAVIRVHLAEGNQSSALEEFERYRTLLRAELDLEPTARLRNLLSGVKAL